MEREPRPTIPGMYCPLVRGDCVKHCRFLERDHDKETGATVPRFCTLELAASAIAYRDE